MYYFEQLLYEAAPTQPPPPVQQAPASQAPVQQAMPAVPTPAPVTRQVPDNQNFNDFDPNMDFSEDDLDSGEAGDPTQEIDDSLKSVKRYYLIQKIFALNDKLNQLRINNDVLNLVISFIDSFSYESLLSLSNRLVEDIYTQIKTEMPSKQSS
jgi:hypothetical protein